MKRAPVAGGLILSVSFCSLLLGACGGDTPYELSWRFADDAQIASAERCGARGVESFVVSEVSDSGQTIVSQALCSAGRIRRAVPDGMWQVSLQGLDLHGAPTMPGSMTLTGTAGPFQVQAGAVLADVTVVVTPRPVCSDGIDNDRDGAVDADDTGCQTGTGE